MGQGLTPYAVSLARLRATCGSGRTDVIRAIRRECETLIADVDGAFRDAILGGAPDVVTAVTALVDGRPRSKGASAFMYRHALEVLCAHLGTRLDAPMLSRTTGKFLRSVDRRLAELGVDAFTTGDLTARKPPVPLPRWSGLPTIGTLEHEVVTSAARQMSDLRTKTPTSFRERPMDDLPQRAVLEIAEWVTAARRVRGGLVCFYG